MASPPSDQQGRPNEHIAQVPPDQRDRAEKCCGVRNPRFGGCSEGQSVRTVYVSRRCTDRTRLMPSRRNRISVCLFLLAFSLAHSADAGLIEAGDLNIIDDLSNRSHGLRYLDVSYGVGRSRGDALAHARATYANARFATPDEFDDLFAAAGITYDGSLTASDAFRPGSGAIISSGRNYDRGVLLNILGQTLRNRTLILTQIPASPDLRNAVDLRLRRARIRRTRSFDANEHYSWLLVSESTALAPEPSSFALFAAGCLIIAARRRRRE